MSSRSAVLRVRGVVSIGAVVAVAAAATTLVPAHAGVPNATITSPTGLYANGAFLPNGRLVQPAGTVTPVGDFPVAVAISPDGAIAVVSNSGQGEGSNPSQGNQSLQVVDLGANRVVQTITNHVAGLDSFFNEGVAFSADGAHVYITGGGNDAVYDYKVQAHRLTLGSTWISTRKSGAPQLPELANAYGYSRNVALAGSKVIVTNEQGGSVTALDRTSGAISWETQLPGSQEIGPYPAGVAVSPDGATAYVTAQGENSVFALDTATGALKGVAPAGDHPVAIAVMPDGKHAFVANDNDDSVSVLSLGSPISQVAQLSTHLWPTEANGSSPNALAIDAARHRLYVTNAGDDAVAVIGILDPAHPSLLGAIPTAWYPTGVAVAPDHSVVAVSAKGYGGVPVTNPNQYDGNDMVGLLNHAPSAANLQAGLRAAKSDLRFAQANDPRPAGSPIPAAPGGPSPIKHVVLVVRENRTFDQVLSDLPHVDGDTHYLMFGPNVTTNAHRVATQFTTSDNFYSDGEASVQGHFWTALGTSTDYIEKSWLHYYSNRNHPYDPANPISYPRCGSIFDQLALAGKTFRNFGELEGLATGQAPTFNTAPGAACATPGGRGDPVSAASADLAGGNNLTLTTVKDTVRLAELEKVYAPLVAADRVPAFSYVLMGNDHTSGSGSQPITQVATNDLAVGGLIDYLSHTPQWSSTAVFVMEDDSQDGLDHRDGHRNILLVASPYANRGAVSHIHVSQAGALHTIELLLGLQPLSAYTQNAPVPYDMFTSKPNLAPYSSVTPPYLGTPAPVSSPIYGTPSAVPINTTEVDLAGPMLEAQLWWATHPYQPMPAMLIDELARRGGVSNQALAAWAAGKACTCRPLLPGLQLAPGFGQPDD